MRDRYGQGVFCLQVTGNKLPKKIHTTTAAGIHRGCFAAVLGLFLRLRLFRVRKYSGVI